MVYRYASLLCLLGFLGLTSCKSTEKAVYRTVRSNNSVALGRLPKLDAVVEPGPLSLQEGEGAYPDDAGKLFRQELSYHLAEPQDDTTRYGYAKFMVTKAEQQRTGRVLQAFQMLTLMTPSLLGVPLEWYRTNVTAEVPLQGHTQQTLRHQGQLGVPLEWYRTNVTAEVQIINARGEVIGTYTGTGRSKVRVAMYHGYGQSKAARLSDVQALRLALDQIRPQLDADADTLRLQLATSGPVEEIIGSAELK